MTLLVICFLCNKGHSNQEMNDHSAPVNRKKGIYISILWLLKYSCTQFLLGIRINNASVRRITKISGHQATDQPNQAKYCTPYDRNYLNDSRIAYSILLSAVNK